MSGSRLIPFLAAALVSTSASTLRAEPQAAAQTGKPGTVALVVVNETGKTIVDAVVRMSGPVDRGGTTGVSGLVTFENVPAGTYRARITADGLITFEKEVIVRAGTKSNVEAMLTAAPPPPPAPTPTPTPTPTPVASALKAGESRIAVLPDVIEEMLKSKEAVTDRELGCSGATMSRLILARENISLHRHADIDEVIYVVAGEANISITEKDQQMAPGAFALVPRGMSHSLTRRGRTPLVLLSVQSGQPCK
jgi:mannose-6-phosphate isomerase-like protein (cupin superfamily)